MKGCWPDGCLVCSRAKTLCSIPAGNFCRPSCLKNAARQREGGWVGGRQRAGEGEAGGRGKGEESLGGIDKRLTSEALR